MIAYRRLVWGTAALMVLGSAGAVGQTTVADAGPDPDSRARRSVLDRRASLRVRAAALPLAIAQLSESADLVAAYSPSQLAAYERTVDCECIAVTVREALERLLEGTPFTFLALQDQVVVYRQASIEADLPRTVEEADAAASRIRFTSGERFVAPPIQEWSVRGRVVDARTGDPIEGARLTVEGSQRSVLTDGRGRFVIDGLTATRVALRVTMLGYNATTVDATPDGGALKIALAPAVFALDEMVVTGTAGETSRRAIGNSVSSIRASEVTQVTPVEDVGDLLNGRAAGVVITPGTGQVGAGPSIQVRGLSSLSLRTEPLIYIDGVRVSNDIVTGLLDMGQAVVSRLGDLDPDEIESIEVIKGPAAATLYGTEASNGVIHILTRRGAEGAPRFRLSVQEGANWFMDPEARIDPNYFRDPATGQVTQQNLVAQEAAAGRPIFETGRSRSYDASLTGGSERIQYYFVAGHDVESGIEPTNGFERSSARVNLQLAAVDGLDVSANVGLIRARRELSLSEGGGVLYATINGNPALRDSPSRGFLRTPPEVFWSAYETTQDVSRYTAGITLEHRAADWFRQRLVLGADQTAENNQRTTELQPDSIGMFLDDLDRAGRKIVSRRDLWVSTVTYDGTVTLPAADGLISRTSIGAQYNGNETVSQYSEGRGFSAPGLRTVSAAASSFGGESFIETTSLGMYLQQQFGWRDRLFVTAALRADDNSAFGAAYDFVTYPKLSGSWVMSDEPFFDMPWVDEVKLRGAYGQTGQQPRAFAALRTYSATVGPDGRPTITPDAFGNPELAPERGEEFEAGIETSLLDRRLIVDLGYYDQKTRDAILLRPVAPSSGFAGSQFVNAGLVTNRGFEALAEVVAVQRPDVRWSVTLNAATNDNEVVDLDPDDPTLTFLPLGFGRHQEGYPVSSYFAKRVVSATVDPETGQAVGVQCDGGPGQSPLPCSEAPRVYLGHPTPRYEGSLRSALTLWGRVSLHAMLDFKTGHKRLNLDDAVRCTLFRICEAAVFPERSDPILVAEIQQGPTFETISSFVQDAGFARLREISMSVLLPERWAAHIGASRARVTAAARNLHTWTDYGGLDPEGVFLPAADLTSVYAESANTPQLSSFVLSLDLSW